MLVLANLRIPLTKQDKDRRDVMTLRYREDVISEKLGNNTVTAIEVHDFDKFTCLNANVRVGLTNFKELQYYGPLYLGSQREKLNFVYDTGSSWLWFPKKT